MSVISSLLVSTWNDRLQSTAPSLLPRCQADEDAQTKYRTVGRTSVSPTQALPAAGLHEQTKSLWFPGTNTAPPGHSGEIIAASQHVSQLAAPQHM
jgi:hypothetical protein